MSNISFFHILMKLQFTGVMLGTAGEFLKPFMTVLSNDLFLLMSTVALLAVAAGVVNR